MVVMAAPRKRTPLREWEEAPPEVPIQELLRIRDELDTGKCRSEVIGGAVVVSPMPVLWHEEACQWLLLNFLGTCTPNQWFADTAGEILLPPTGDLIVPDFMVLRDRKTLSRLESRRPLDRVLLTAEVVSSSSIRQDREVKPRACALAGIPLYLLVDRFTEPLTISLASEPGANGYGVYTTVDVGQKLHIPAPFDLTLDTSTLPLPE